MNADIITLKNGVCDLQATVGMNIHRMRKVKRLTLADLAYKMETTPQTIQRLEKGNMTMSIHWLESFAKALNCQPYQLVLSPGEAPVMEQIQSVFDETMKKCLQVWLEDRAKEIGK
jgi:transcriptional regulator with XRE-family HTH domain